jgi:hypothetical protein
MAQITQCSTIVLCNVPIRVAYQSTLTGASFAGEGERTIIAASLTETEREWWDC